MIVDASSDSSLKRRKFTADIDSMEAQQAAQAKLAAAKEKFGREIRVFELSTLSSSSQKQESNTEEDDELEFTSADYYRCLKVKEDNILKTRKIREAEQAARRSRITKTVIRVRFPDNHTFEATFHPSEKVQSLVDLLMKVVARPEIPFYIYTTPPKKQIKDMEQDFYSAGFVPGAIVYFSYDIPKDDAADANAGPFLQEEIVSLKGLELISKPAEPVEAAPETKPEVPPPAVQENKSAEKKPAKPKWFKR